MISGGTAWIRKIIRENRDKLTFDLHREQIQRIIKSADLIVGYNLDFDLNFLKKEEIKFFNIDTFDVMIKFSLIYGEFDRRRKYKYQKLKTCCAFYGYSKEIDFHNSLEDAKATLFCYLEMIKEAKKEIMAK